MAQDLRLPSSELGTKSYWDNAYDDEISNFREHGDTGEIWFGKGITRKVVEWIADASGADRTGKILDLGCGNGYTLLQLHHRQFCNLTGFDYSEQAIDLARQVAQKENAAIQYAVVDILQSPVLSERYDFIIDKGTFDAICLNPSVLIDNSKQHYISFVQRHLKDTGFFIISSCNWTKEELLAHFSPHMDKIDEIPSPAFTFGGKQGNRITTLIWQHRLQR